MKKNDLTLYVCPECQSPDLLCEADGGGEVEGEINAAILCCRRCPATYRVVEGIPRFVSNDGYAESFGFQWRLYRRTQLDSYTGLSISRDRLLSATGWQSDLRGQLILEVGSGAGRFTEVLATTGAEIFSFDFSTAVEANYKNNGHHANVHLFQGDIFSIPLRDSKFDKVLCLGVLQHTPDPQAAFQSLARHVRPGGELVVDVYAMRLGALLSWKYLLRPVACRMEPRRLHQLVEAAVHTMLPAAVILRRMFGRFGARILPIVEYSHLGLPPHVNREWAVLDTFDMYSPAHDHPQRRRTVRGWFEAAGFIDVRVVDGPNGLVGHGVRPLG